MGEIDNDLKSTDLYAYATMLENKVKQLEDVIEKAETDIDELVELMENDSENDYANLVAEIGFKLQKELEDKDV